MNPDYPLILAGNRDEFYNRPTLPLGYWEDDPDILAGRDLKEMGTWLGISRQGGFAAITNYRDPAALNPAAPSRGNLVRNYLQGHAPPREYLEAVMEKGNLYNGFNLLAGDMQQLYYYSNKNESVIEVSPGLHGLSNRLLDTPWPKVEKGKAHLKPFQDVTDIDVNSVFDALYDTSFPPTDQLPDTGVDKEWEKVLSPMFIKSETYGTRSSAVLLIKKDGNILISERTFDVQSPDQKMTQKTRHFEFHVNGRDNEVL